MTKRMKRTPGWNRWRRVRSVRARIDAVVSAEERREILIAVGCFEPQVAGGSPRFRRATVQTARGAELLAAIDALDRACLQGSDAEIEATGARLVEQWKAAKQAMSDDVERRA
jgi:hypothetical protein